MVELTDVSLTRIVDAEVRWSLPRSSYPPGTLGDEEWLRSVVAKAVVDTSLYLDGTLGIEAFDQ